MVVLHVSSTCVSGEPLPPSAADSTSSQQRRLLQHHPPLFLPALPPTDWEPMWWTRTEDHGGKKNNVWSSNTNGNPLRSKRLILEQLSWKRFPEKDGWRLVAILKHLSSAFSSDLSVFAAFTEFFHHFLWSSKMQVLVTGVLVNFQITSRHLLFLTDCSFETEAKIGSKMKSWETAKKKNKQTNPSCSRYGTNVVVLSPLQTFSASLFECSPDWNARGGYYWIGWHVSFVKVEQRMSGKVNTLAQF